MTSIGWPMRAGGSLPLASLALAAFWAFREMGVEPGRIAEVINDGGEWRRICDVASGRQTSSTWIGIVRDSKGRIVLESDRRSDADPERDMSRLNLNLADFDEGMRPQLSADELI